jgi:molybdopterin adenylyltransferase
MKAAVLTVSDRSARGERDDASGPALESALVALGFSVTLAPPVADERGEIAARLRALAASHDLVVTTGGTGLSPRDVTPEATRDVIDREAPGLAEAMRFLSLQKTPHAMLSRAVSGLRGRTLIVNMPGSPRACREQFAMIRAALPHGVEKLLDQGGDCATP